MPAPARLAFTLLLLAVPTVAHAQGTAPGQGVTLPIPQGTPPAQPPAPQPGDLSNGRPKADTGGGAADTAPGTTSSLPLPPPGQANPPDKQ
jgi:hypothetical protein